MFVCTSVAEGKRSSSNIGGPVSASHVSSFQPLRRWTTVTNCLGAGTAFGVCGAAPACGAAGALGGCEGCDGATVVAERGARGGCGDCGARAGAAGAGCGGRGGA